MRFSQAMEDYLQRKRATGLRYEGQEDILREFRLFVDDLNIEEIEPKQIVDFLNSRNVSNDRWTTKNRCLTKFFEFWTHRGCMSPLTMPHRPRRGNDLLRIPFIYTRTQVKKLIQATHANQSHRLCVVSDATFRTVLLALYGTGATTSEIFWLKRSGLDLKRNLVSLVGNWQVAPRKVPLSSDLHHLLVNYLRSEERRSATSPYVFVTKRGGPLTVYAMELSFARLRKRAGVFRVDGDTRQPQMRDLRQTFAVHRISSWIEERVDLNRMLPALSAYMGMGGVASIQRFLFMTPERFKRQLDRLSPSKGRKHWRDDPRLMQFIAKL